MFCTRPEPNRCWDRSYWTTQLHNTQYYSHTRYTSNQWNTACIRYKYRNRIANASRHINIETRASAVYHARESRYREYSVQFNECTMHMYFKQTRPEHEWFLLNIFIPPIYGFYGESHPQLSSYRSTCDIFVQFTNFSYLHRSSLSLAHRIPVASFRMLFHNLRTWKKNWRRRRYTSISPL